MRIARRSVVAGLAALPLASGCSRRPGDALEFWAMGAEAENLPALLASITAEANPEADKPAE